MPSDARVSSTHSTKAAASSPEAGCMLKNASSNWSLVRPYLASTHSLNISQSRKYAPPNNCQAVSPSTNGPSCAIWNWLNWSVDTPSARLSRIPSILHQNWHKSYYRGRVPSGAKGHSITSSSHWRLSGTAFSSWSRVILGATSLSTTFLTLRLNIANWAAGLGGGGWNTSWGWAAQTHHLHGPLQKDCLCLLQYLLFNLMGGHVGEFGYSAHYSACHSLHSLP